MSSAHPASGHEIAAVRQLGQLLTTSPAYYSLGREARHDLDHALDRIQRFLEPTSPTLASQMAPDLRAQLSPGGGGSGPTPASPSPSTQPPATTGTPPAGGSGGGGSGAVGRV